VAAAVLFVGLGGALLAQFRVLREKKHSAPGFGPF
jgi:hypothetical protein